MRTLPGSLQLFLCVLTVLLPASEHARADDRVYAKAEAVEPLAAGARVPSVQVQTVRGEAVDLAEVVRERGALLVFYRGGW